MHPDAKPPISAAGYGSARATKPPDWHALIVWDILFNSLATGTFLIAAASEFAAPAAFAGVVKIAYAVAWCFLLADLACLVFDLGDPWRFHHMLRVCKPSSPMSLGTWSLTAYSLPLTLIVLFSLLPASDLLLWLHRLAVAVGILPALAAFSYKGVLFSTTSQPGWREARWLGAYHATSSLVLGGAVLLLVAVLFEQESATEDLRLALGTLLVVSAIPVALLAADLYAVLNRADASQSWLLVLGIALGLGVAVPLLLLWLGGAVSLVMSSVLILLGGLIVRWAIVQLPHRAVAA
jgi:Ni/Fe-hydrogenase subunit HybB-like protein